MAKTHFLSEEKAKQKRFISLLALNSERGSESRELNVCSDWFGLKAPISTEISSEKIIVVFLIEKNVFIFISVILWTLRKRKLIHPQPGKISIFVTSENKYILKYIEHRIRFHLFVVNIVLCI